MDTVKPATNSTATTAISPPNTRKSPQIPSGRTARPAGGYGHRRLLASPPWRSRKSGTALEQEATALGRQALAHELASLEGITLDEAIKAAEITQAAVRLLVLPLAQLVATIGGDGLAVLLGGPDDRDGCAQQCPYHGGRAQRTARHCRVLA